MGAVERRAILQDVRQQVRHMNHQIDNLQQRFEEHVHAYRKSDVRHRRNARIVEVLGELMKKLAVVKQRRRP